jgi:hypothetical protein
VTVRRRRRTGGELWSATDRRALGYVRLEDSGSAGLPRHVETIERLCDSRGLELADIVVDVEGGAELESAPPGLGWALKQLAAGGAGALAVAWVEHVTGAYADAEQLTRWFDEQGVTLVAAGYGGGSGPSPAETAAPDSPARRRHGARRAPGVGPRSWARYVHARTDDGRLPN